MQIPGPTLHLLSGSLWDWSVGVSTSASIQVTLKRTSLCCMPEVHKSRLCSRHSCPRWKVLRFQLMANKLVLRPRSSRWTLRSGQPSGLVARCPWASHTVSRGPGGEGAQAGVGFPTFPVCLERSSCKRSTRRVSSQICQIRVFKIVPPYCFKYFPLITMWLNAASTSDQGRKSRSQTSQVANRTSSV